jgi:hypothetical protein
MPFLESRTLVSRSRAKSSIVYSSGTGDASGRRRAPSVKHCQDTLEPVRRDSFHSVRIDRERLQRGPRAAVVEV